MASPGGTRHRTGPHSNRPHSSRVCAGGAREGVERSVFERFMWVEWTQAIYDLPFEVSVK